MEYKIVVDYSSNDNDEAIWKDYNANHRWTRPKRNLSEVDMIYDHIRDTWMVSIDFNGVTGSTAWDFEKPKDAKRLYDQLRDYMISK
jgi:hypothetical protein